VLSGPGTAATSATSPSPASVTDACQMPSAGTVTVPMLRPLSRSRTVTTTPGWAIPRTLIGPGEKISPAAGAVICGRGATSSM